MTLLAVLRHADTEWNERGLMQGRRDVPLSAAGRRAVAGWRLPDSLSGLHWFSSPLRRAIETAALLSGAPPQPVAALIEMDWGEWEGATLSELRDRLGPAFAANERRGLDFRPPGGESPREVMSRVRGWLAPFGARDRPAIAVTHKGVLRTMLADATGWDMLGRPPVKLAAGCVHRFEVDGTGRIRLRECNIPMFAAPCGGRL